MVKPVLQTLLRSMLAAGAGLLAVPSAIAAGAQYGYVDIAAASKSAAAEEAREQHGGKVLKVEEASDGGRKVYRVKLLLEGGRIKIVTVGASNG